MDDITILGDGPSPADPHTGETPIYAELATEWLGSGRTVPAPAASGTSLRARADDGALSG